MQKYTKILMCSIALLAGCGGSDSETSPAAPAPTAADPFDDPMMSSASVDPYLLQSSTSIDPSLFMSSAAPDPVQFLSSASIEPDSSQTITPVSSSAVEDAANYMVDPRDKQKYRITTIGSKVWMAQNLNYDGTCMYGTPSFCDKFGSIYTWEQAMFGKQTGCSNMSSSCTNLTADFQGICPDGWHVPTGEELSQMVAVTGGDFLDKNWSVGYKKADAYGFSLLPGGYETEVGRYYGADDFPMTYLWSATEVGASLAQTLSVQPCLYDGLQPCEDYFVLENANKQAHYYVRCVKN